MKALLLFLTIATSGVSHAQISIDAGIFTRIPPLNIDLQVGGGPIRVVRAGFYGCHVTAFMDTYSDTGSTRAEAKYKAQSRCMANHHSMHCQDVRCDGEDVPAARVVAYQPYRPYRPYRPLGYTCMVSAFGDDFEAFGETLAEATFRAREKCRYENDSMFCEDVRYSQ